MDRDPLIQHLRTQFTKPLLGLSSQKKMAVTNRILTPPKSNQKIRQAATLLLLYKKENEWYFPLIQRPGNPNDKHSGQISFPGGMREDSDIDFAYTALRETYEEIGLPKEDNQILGKLSELYIDVSNFNIHPYVGFTQVTPKFTAQISEVADIIEFPLALLQDESIRKKKEIKVRNFTLKDVPYFDFQNKTIWGATAMILSEFADLIKG